MNSDGFTIDHTLEIEKSLEEWMCLTCKLALIVLKNIQKCCPRATNPFILYKIIIIKESSSPSCLQTLILGFYCFRGVI